MYAVESGLLSEVMDSQEVVDCVQNSLILCDQSVGCLEGIAVADAGLQVCEGAGA